MSTTLDVIALISGGKDSLYSILHCVQHGHNVVALANLYPDLGNPSPLATNSTQQIEDASADVNSFMYQTVGHSVIPLYSEALGIPLYRRAIQGTAVVSDRDYAYDAQSDASLDETEDLMPLLREIMSQHPTANAITTGAIQSTYQRTRVESVALRLGLTPLAFLWQYPLLPAPPTRSDSLTGLLDDMALAGCDARIIKIASGGISERLLWANVTQSQNKQALVKDLSPFFDGDKLGLKGAVVGEGGEFETIALDGPEAVWKNGRIEVEIDKTQTWTGDGGTSYIELGRARLVSRSLQEISEPPGRTEQTLVPVPAMFDAEFSSIESTMSADITVLQSSPESAEELIPSLEGISLLSLGLRCIKGQNSIEINNINYKNINSSLCDSAVPVSANQQMENMVDYIPTLLQEIGQRLSLSQPLTTASIVHTTVVLRDMDVFASMNPIYASMFLQVIPNPPARVTIAAQLPLGIDVSMSLIVDCGPRKQRRGLHVQSRSYWAPANIGPYSQAIAVSAFDPKPHSGEEEAVDVEVVHVAGQIPLVPASMTMFAGPFYRKAILSLQHLWRLGQEREVDLWAFGLAFLATGPTKTETISSAFANLLPQTRIAAHIWRQRHYIYLDDDKTTEETVEEPDIWDMRYNRSFGTHDHGTGRRQGQDLRALPYKSQPGTIILPPFVAAQVSALPRLAEIEWWSIGLSKICSTSTQSVRPSINFQLQMTADHTFSVLEVKTGDSTSNTVVMVAYMVRRQDGSKQSTVRTGIYTTVNEVVQHSLQEFDIARLNLTSSIGYVASHATTMKKLFSSNVYEQRARAEQQTSSHISTKDDLLGDVSSIVCTDRLWGHAGQLLNPNSKDPSFDHEELAELDAAFLLRFTTS